MPATGVPLRVGCCAYAFLPLQPGDSYKQVRKLYRHIAVRPDVVDCGGEGSWNGNVSEAAPFPHFPERAVE
jgi:hypothetical protein